MEHNSKILDAMAEGIEKYGAMLLQHDAIQFHKK